jgi:hypothetical protein
MKTIITFLLAALIALPTQAETKAAATRTFKDPVILTEAQIAAVKAYVAESLKDPESARFRGIKATGEVFPHKDTGLPTFSGIVCGYVNAKNSYGAYVGMMPFTVQVIGEPLNKPNIANDARSVGLVIKFCREQGIDLTD